MATRRNTTQRRAIRDVIAAADRPLSTQEILDGALGQAPGLGVATVYRTIKLLLEEGWITSVKLPGEPPRYEIAGKPHHHHFHCRGCGRLFEVPGRDELLSGLVPKGFVLESRDLVLSGRCADCVRGAKRSSSQPTADA